jgi:hypothetical protein
LHGAILYPNERWFQPRLLGAGRFG